MGAAFLSGDARLTMLIGRFGVGWDAVRCVCVCARARMCVCVCVCVVYRRRAGTGA